MIQLSVHFVTVNLEDTQQISVESRERRQLSINLDLTQDKVCENLRQ